MFTSVLSLLTENVLWQVFHHKRAIIIGDIQKFYHPKIVISIIEYGGFVGAAIIDVSIYTIEHKGMILLCDKILIKFVSNFDKI